jgi:uncharacterized protein YrrD
MFGKVASSLRTFTTIKGIPVYAIESGSCIGKIEDLLFKNNGDIQGLLYNPKNILKGKKVIPLESIKSIGPDGLLINEANLSHFTKNMNEYYSLEHQNKVIGKPLMTEEGEKLGLVQDVYFQEELGKIEGIEVTDGWFADITEGRKVVKTTKPPEIGDDILIVHIP